MAKKKTPAELRAEAQALIKKAQEEQQKLLKLAREAEVESYKEIGEFTIKFLKNEIDLDSLRLKAAELGLIEI